MTTRGARRVVIMGVSGSCKTAVGSALAARLGWRFIDADDLHSPANIAKMSGGVRLTDQDRGPWLAAVARQLASDGDEIAACSALRRPYRNTIADAVPRVFFVHLTVPPATLAARMRTREGHFMPSSLRSRSLAGEVAECDRCMWPYSIDAVTGVRAAICGCRTADR